MNKGKKYLIKKRIMESLLLNEDLFVCITTFQCYMVFKFAYGLGTIINESFVISAVKDILNVNMHYIDHEKSIVVFYNEVDVSDGN